MITKLNESYGKTTVSKSQLEKELTDTFNKYMCSDEEFDAADQYFLNIDIHQEDQRVVVSVEAETYFDTVEHMSYGEYKSLMAEFGYAYNLMSKDEYYDSIRNTKTLEDEMDTVLKKYNPSWYFELWNATEIRAYLDDCILKP